MHPPDTQQSLTLRDWRAARPVLLRTYSGVMPSDSLQATFHPHHFTAWLIEAGQATVIVDNTELHATSGDWLVLHRGRRRHNVVEGTRLWSAHFQFETGPGVPVIDFLHGMVFSSSDYPHLAERAERLRKVTGDRLGADPHTYLPGQQASFMDYLALQSAFLSWLEALLEAARSLGLLQMRLGGDAADQLRHYLDDVKLAQRLDVAEMERAGGLSGRHLNRIFRARFGVTPGRYFDDRRANYARDHLLNTSDSIKEIALSLGFVHLSQFSNWFSRHEGCPPSTFRTRHGRRIGG